MIQQPIKPFIAPQKGTGQTGQKTDAPVKHPNGFVLLPLITKLINSNHRNI